AMVLFYLSYVLLDNYRIHQSEKWKAINNLTLQDIQAIQKLASLNTAFETLFIGLFLIVVLYLLKKKRGKLISFLTINACLFAALFLISYLSSFFLQSPIGNLTQPLFLPIFLLVLLMFYCILISLKNRFSRSV
ncbi:MAG: hypothetical protein KBT36_12465, partial [Kurthia sp.]|nr:hypothetical protein [Candidatus Kurthia equi]